MPDQLNSSPSPVFGPPVVGGPGVQGKSKLLQLIQRLWTNYRWYVVGGVVVPVAGLVVIFVLHYHRQPHAVVSRTNQPEQQEAQHENENSTPQQNTPSGDASKDANKTTPTNTQKTTSGTGGQNGGTTGTPSAGGGGASGGCSSIAGTPGGADAWGGCWPGASNTGVPSGTSLVRVPQDATSGSGWSWDGADQIINVTGSNAVLSGLNVSGQIIVSAAGVTIANSKATGIGMSGAARNTANARLTIRDSEIDCGNQGGTSGVGDINFTALRLNIHGCENGFDADSDIAISDSYIHDLFNSTVGDPHTDGLQSAVGSNMTIAHNVFYGFTSGCVYPNNGSCNGTSAININNNPSGPHSSNTTVSKNLLAGGAFALYCPVPSTTSFQVLDNHFSTIYSPHVGEFDPSSDCGGETQSGNVIHETGQGMTLG